MVTIHYDQWFLIERQFLFGNEAINPSYINLATHIWEDMRYDKSTTDLIDFPGEYDIRGITIQCFLGNQDKLNYLINYAWDVFAIIQSPDVLENNTDLAVAKTWLYTSENVVEKIDQLELEWDKIKLENPETTVETSEEA